MKTRLTIIIIMILNCISIKSQDRDPNQQSFYYLGQTRQLNADNALFQPRGFTLGWHWASGRSMSSGLKWTCGQTTDSIPTAPGSMVWIPVWASRFADSVDLIIDLKGVYANGLSLSSLNSMMMTFEPTLKINNPGQLETRSGDPTNPVFGFKYIHPGITIRDTDRELKLNKTGGYGSPANPQVVLSEPWSKNELKHVPGMESDDLLNPITNYNGTEWYFTMKIRRNELSQIMDDSTVLTVRLPYRAIKYDTVHVHVYKDSIVIVKGIPVDTIQIFVRTDLKDTIFRTEGYIKFDSIPNENYYSYYKEYDTTRGVYRDCQAGYNTTEIIIKRKHIIRTTDSSITVCAKFICNDIYNDINNYYLNSEDNNPDKYFYFIDSIGIDVTYHGVLNLAIDFCKFETKNAQMLYRGGFDSKITTAVQSALNIFSDTSFTNRGIRPLRFYTRDEGNKVFWGATRYFNKLVGNLGTFEVGPVLPDLYKHYVNPPENWYSFYKIYSGTAAPYLRNGSSGDTSPLATATYCGLQRGTHWENDSINSGYETISKYKTINLFDPSVPFQTYLNNLGKFSTIQALFDEFAIKGYLMENRNNLLFNGKKWWAQSFIYAKSPKLITPSGFSSQLDTLVYFESRTKTAHELSIFCWQPLILGAKGVLFDGEESSNAKITPFKEKRIATNIGKNQFYYESCQLNDTTHLADLEGWDFIMHDSVGTDFINPDYDWSGINEYIEWDIVPQALGVARDRMYVGRKSNRIELKKFSEFIHQNESIIMPLKLQSWLGKSFRKYYIQHPDYTQDTIMSNFFAINTRGIKTRPIGREHTNGLPFYENEALDTLGSIIDSSFYDITILADSLITPSTSTIYVGMLNRRTSPLIHIDPEVDENEQNEHLLFLSMAEINELCENGGFNPESNVYKTAEEWRSLYWKRNACREITIPFNYCDSTNPNDYVLLHVKELKADNAYDSTWSWWRKERYANYIDTIIGQNSSLAVKFQPGEGKLFSCQILRPNPIQGNLAHSNQSKFVVFPDGDNDSIVRYHITYHKPDTLHNNVMSVFYSRSFPMNRNSENMQIIWEPEICISDSIKLVYGKPPNNVNTMLYNAPAHYPSIVVRKDGPSTKAYIVYQTLFSALVPEFQMTACYPDRDTSKYFLNPICEKILNVGGHSVTQPQNPNVLDSIVYGDPEIFGTPVINASKNGNFVAWADEECGIKFGYKEINQPIFSSQSSIKIEGNNHKHPSLNIYSLLDKDENDCSLVFQSGDITNPMLGSAIYYTKLRIGANGIKSFIPPTINSDDDIEIFDTLIKMNRDIYCSMPTVYRLLKADTSMISGRHFQGEIVAWQTDYSNHIVLKNLLNYYVDSQTDKYLFSNISSNKYIRSRSIGVSPLTGLVHSFSNPVLSQPTSYRKEFGTSPVGVNGFDFLLNFQDNWTQDTSSGNLIYHLRQGFYITADIYKTKITEFNKMVYPVAEGTNNHLAYSPVANEGLNVWKNHRVYEHKTLAGYSKIVPNPIYFHPFEECTNCRKPLTFISIMNENNGGGISKLAFSLSSAPPIPLPINLPYQTVFDSLGSYLLPTQSDTIYSDWLYIDTTAEISYLAKLNDTSIVTFKLQKLSDGSFVELPAPFLPETGFSYQVYYLVNGNNDEYRLAMINNNPDLHYSEDMYFETPTVIDTIYAKRSYEVKKNVVNLNKNISLNKQFNLQCMPNPANEVLKVAVYSNQNIKAESVNIQIYNYQGKVVWESNSIPNSTSTIPVSNFENGIYLVRANILTENGYITETSKVVIMR